MFKIIEQEQIIEQYRCKYTHFSNIEHYKITHFYTNNKQATDNQAIPITDYPPEDIQNVSKKSHTQSEKSHIYAFSKRIPTNALTH